MHSLLRLAIVASVLFTSGSAVIAKSDDHDEAVSVTLDAPEEDFGQEEHWRNHPECGSIHARGKFEHKTNPKNASRDN